MASGHGDLCMDRFKRVALGALFLVLITLYGCQGMVPEDTQSLLIPRFRRSEISVLWPALERHLQLCPTCSRC